MDKVISQLRQAFRDNSDPRIAESSKRFFKEEIKFYGMKTADLRKIGKEAFKTIKDWPKKEIFVLCEELWKSGYMEECMIACIWSNDISKRFEPGDFKVLERWVEKYVTNWATCDTLCNHTVGNFLMMYPEYVNELKKWARTPNRWVRRAAAVSLIIPARKGLFMEDIFEIADILLTDNEDLVQKGYGWMLKVADQKHRKEVFGYVMSKRKVMPRTALRYAIEKMPADMRKEAMRKD